MLQAARKLCLIMVILVVAVLIGCGSDTDLLDPLPGTDGYSAILSVLENGTEGLQVDTVQDLCLGGSSGEPEPEPWSDTLGSLEISVDADATGLTLDHYSIEYIPLVDVGVTAPTLTNPSAGYSNAYIGPGETLTLPITLVSVDVKLEFDQAMGWLYYDGTDWVWSTADPNPLGARYYIRVTLHFVNSDTALTVGRTAYFSDYDNCE